MIPATLHMPPARRQNVLQRSPALDKFSLASFPTSLQAFDCSSESRNSTGFGADDNEDCKWHKSRRAFALTSALLSQWLKQAC